MRDANRRLFLLSAAGTLALPLLDSWNASAASGTPPKRIVLFYHPNGVLPRNWFPQSSTSETDFDLSPILQPLASHRNQLTIVRGVSSTVAQDPDNNGGPHQRGIGSLFTGEMLLPGNFTDGCGKKAGWAAGPSIDQVIAQELGGTTPFSSIEVGVRANQDDVQGRIAYAGPGKPLPPTNDPVGLYQRLFARTASLDPSNPDSRKQSILSTVGAQYRTLSQKVSAADREKVETHFALVEDLERRLGLAGSATCQLPVAPKTQNVDSELTMPLISRAHLDLLATALACDLTRVASVQYCTGFNRIRYPWLDTYGEGHALSHSGDSDAGAWEALSNRVAWHAGELAYFLDRLAAIPEGEGTVLDNTLVLWGSEVSVGNTHSLDNLPYLICGSAGGAIRTGRLLTFDRASNCDFLHTILAGFGVERPSFGNPEHASGVLAGILA